MMTQNCWAVEKPAMMAHLGGKQVQVLVGGIQQAGVGALGHNGHHFGIAALGKQAHGAVLGAENDAHAPPVAAELQHLLHLQDRAGTVSRAHTLRNVVMVTCMGEQARGAVLGRSCAPCQC